MQDPEAQGHAGHPRRRVCSPLQHPAGVARAGGGLRRRDRPRSRRMKVAQLPPEEHDTGVRRRGVDQDRSVRSLKERVQGPPQTLAGPQPAPRDRGRRGQRRCSSRRSRKRRSRWRRPRPGRSRSCRRSATTRQLKQQLDDARRIALDPQYSPAVQAQAQQQLQGAGRARQGGPHQAVDGLARAHQGRGGVAARCRGCAAPQTAGRHRHPSPQAPQPGPGPIRGSARRQSPQRTRIPVPPPVPPGVIAAKVERGAGPAAGKGDRGGRQGDADSSTTRSRRCSWRGSILAASGVSARPPTSRPRSPAPTPTASARSWSRSGARTS